MRFRLCLFDLHGGEWDLLDYGAVVGRTRPVLEVLALCAEGCVEAAARRPLSGAVLCWLNGQEVDLQFFNDGVVFSG